MPRYEIISCINIHFTFISSLLLSKILYKKSCNSKPTKTSKKSYKTTRLDMDCQTLEDDGLEDVWWRFFETLLVNNLPMYKKMQEKIFHCSALLERSHKNYQNKPWFRTCIRWYLYCQKLYKTGKLFVTLKLRYNIARSHKYLLV